jgi:predicted O-linked N-acetylglucosamine transferase (SPINDLY family)
MGLLDCVVDSAEAYVDLAVRLGTDRDYRQHMSQSILDRCDALYSDMRAIEGHADFFEKATQALRTG